MTTEEKAKAYDDALEKAKKYMDEGYTVLMPDLFPQLHESEDEQTRKRLVDFISNIKRISESGRAVWAVRDGDVEMCNAFLSYLEKQKYHFRDDTKKVEKQDYSGLTDLERVIHRGFLSAGVENVPVTIIKETANECKRIANENANAEWSEDDKSFYDSIMCEVVKEGMHPTPEQANWLKSLPKRFNLQSKQDWSEEDECYINGLIGLIEDMEVGISPKLRGVAADRCVAFLKSLRPRPHWKPSKEQMNCLCAAVDAAIRKHNESVSEYKPARVLKSLYEQLQRLGVKEEPEYYQHFDPDC